MRFIAAVISASLRIIDFKRDKTGIPATVISIEYDPTARRGLRCWPMPTARSVTSFKPEGLKVGQKVVERPDADILVGNALPLRNIPSGHADPQPGMKPGKGGQMVRSAGGSAQLRCQREEYALVKLPSGETRKVSQD